MSKVTITRLDLLKSELDILNTLRCISFDALDVAKEHYRREIAAIEEYGSDNPTREYTVVEKELYI